jgi:hypothetical protein
MKKKPVKVRLVGREKSDYKIKFPYLDIPVVVNEYIYNQMLESNEYQFANATSKTSLAHSQFR